MPETTERLDLAKIMAEHEGHGLGVWATCPTVLGVRDNHCLFYHLAAELAAERAKVQRVEAATARIAKGENGDYALQEAAEALRAALTG